MHLYLLRKSILKILNNHIRKNKLFTRFLFDIKIGYNDRIHWDFTTLILKKVLAEHVKPMDKVLEIGTGPFALLSQWLRRQCNCTIHAGDINPRYVDSARQCIMLNSSTISVFQSDLFDGITECYDVIFFNSVYIPTERGRADGIDKLHEYRTDWCGGLDGLETIKKFLVESKGHLLPKGKVLLGFNGAYIKKNNVMRLCEQSGFSITGMRASPVFPSKVFVLEPT
jgi:HemK-related putative methylase